MSNTIGLVPGSASGAWSYRRELAGQRGRLIGLGSASLLGGIAGALLLLTLSAGVFKAVVPVLIIIALGLVWWLVSPTLSVVLLIALVLAGILPNWFTSLLRRCIRLHAADGWSSVESRRMGRRERMTMLRKERRNASRGVGGNDRRGSVRRCQNIAMACGSDCSITWKRSLRASGLRSAGVIST